MNQICLTPIKLFHPAKSLNRILDPSSKKRAYEYKDMFFERFDFELHHVYRALTHFSNIAEECQRFISDQINKKFDSKTFIPGFKDVCVRFNPGRVIAIADMGCASSDNIYFLKGGDRDKRVNGYVFSFSIRKSSKAFKKFVLDDSGYTDRDGKPLKEGYDFKIKSRIEVREIQVTMRDGSKKSFLIDEKQVVFWSEKYAKKARAEREETIKKALDVISNPQKYNKSTVHGAAAYIKNITFDKKTGEVYEEPGKKLLFDKEKAEEEATPQ